MLTFDELLLKLPSTVVHQMETTYQSPLHHAEGSVLEHSRLVSTYAPKEIEFLLASVFHDMGKIATTRVVEEKGKLKISSIGHEDLAVGFINFYKDKFADLNVNWEKVSQMCQYHMRGHLYLNGKLKKPSKRESFENLKYFTDILVFSKADSDGRRETDGPSFLLITVGIPGSGKTTWRRNFCVRTGFSCISPDELREEFTGSISDISRDAEVWKEAYSRLTTLLSSKQNVVFDATNINPKSRKQLVSMGEQYKAIVVYKIFSVGKEVAKERIAKDLAKGVNRSNVPTYIVDKMYDKFDFTLREISQEYGLVLQN